MIRVLQHGKDPEAVQKFCCRHCRCVFEATKDSYTRLTSPKNESMVSATCPECQTLTIKDYEP